MSIVFYFDPISPYSWLAAHHIKQLRASEHEVVCEPVLLGAMLNAFGQKGPAEIEAKRRYTFADVYRRARAAGLSFEGPPSHPFNPLAALRACHCVQDPAQRFELAVTLMDMAWAEGKDISKVDAVLQATDRCEIEIPDLEIQLADPQVKARVKDATQAAIDRGVFGVPMLSVNDELFWGSDRVSDAFAAARGDRAPIDQALLDRVLTRPTSATRR